MSSTTLTLPSDGMWTLGQFSLKDGWYVYRKAFLQWTLPSYLNGATVLAATLSAYVIQGEVDAMSIPVKYCTDVWTYNTGWTVEEMTAAVSAADAYTLTSLATNAAVNLSGWNTWDVKGDGSKGLIEACASSRSKVSLVMTFGSGTNGTQGQKIGVGEIDTGAGQYRLFDFVGNPASPYGAYAPTLDLTYTGGSPPPTVTRAGASAGVLLV